MYSNSNLTYNSDADSSSSSNNLLFFLFFATISIFAIARLAESSNRLNYESRSTRIIAGLLLFFTRMMHVKNENLEIPDAKKTLITVGPHRTGWEPFALASEMKGTAPQFLATDAFNFIPGIPQFMKMFKAIPVKINRIKTESGKSANSSAIEQASKVLSDDGCVALFPQGNFSRIDQAPPIVYPGAARIALKNNIPILVVRLDGFWSLQNPIIPLCIRNSISYRAFFSLLHMNNISVTLCSVIDFHLRPENAHLTDEEKIEEICAELYAYYRHTEDLTKEEIHSIKTEISHKTHLLTWNNAKENNLKELNNLKKEDTEDKSMIATKKNR